MINFIVYDSFREGDIHEIIPDLGLEGIFDGTYVLEPGYPAHHVSYVLEESGKEHHGHYQHGEHS